jgi:AraC-like DNA-binding protein
MFFSLQEGESIFDLSHSVSEKPNATIFEKHCHTTIELIYVVKGKGSYIVEGSEYPLSPNTIILLRPYEYHYVCPREDCPYERYVVHFDEGFPFEAEKTLSPFLLKKYTARSGVYFSEQTVIEPVRHAFEAFDTAHKYFCDNKWDRSDGFTFLRSLVTQIVGFLSVACSTEPTPPQKNLLSDVIEYVNDHIDETLTLEDLSREFFVSKYHLCRAFRRYTGTTFLSYLTTKRIMMAEKLMQEGESATEASYKVGFKDYSTFYRAYRKQTGSAPARERKTL